MHIACINYELCTINIIVSLEIVVCLLDIIDIVDIVDKIAIIAINKSSKYNKTTYTET